MQKMQKKINIKNKKKIFINYYNTKFLTFQLKKCSIFYYLKFFYNLKNSFLYAKIDLNLNFLL